jgi:type I restriction enzyme, S subunit
MSVETIEEEATRTNVPMEWRIVQLGEVLDIVGGSQPPKSTFKYQPEEGYIQLLQIRDYGKKGVATFVRKKSVTKFCIKEDIMIARYGASLGRIITGMEGAYNVALAKVIDRKNQYEKKFLFYLLKTPIFQSPLKLLSRSAQNGFSKSELAHIQLPLPPRKSQKVIVSKIEELFSELDKGIENLKVAQQQLKTYRQSVLKWAFEGKLTNRNLQEDEFLNGWSNIKLHEVANAIDPQPSHRTPPAIPDGIPFVSIKDFDPELDKIDFCKARRVSKEVLKEHLNRYKLEKGDFVIGKIGTIGKPVRVVLPQDYTLSANIVLIQPRKVQSTYLYYFFQSNLIEKAFSIGTKATTQAAFGIQKVRELIIHLPDIDGQQKVVQEIEKRLSVTDKMEESINESLQQAEALRQSIFKKAFEGEL